MTKPHEGAVALTGAGGFVGWHTRLLLHSQGRDFSEIQVGDRFDPARAAAAISGCERLIHIAGVNRGTDEEIAEGNRAFARQLIEAMDAADELPRTVVFANSIQADLDNVYGQAKRGASELLAAFCAERGIDYLDLKLPNLFGEHGKPFYNSVVATFCHLVATGGEPTVENDKELGLLHVGDAAKALTGQLSPEEMSARVAATTVSAVLEKVRLFAGFYGRGDIPELRSDFDLNLFNTYRSYAFEERPAIELKRNSDPRGSFVELIRSHGGDGQSSFSTTVPGVTRGQHYHLRKIERFIVIAGTAEMKLRKMFTDETVTIPASGEAPVAVDMPTGWSHNITNTGQDILYTMFWTNDIFDPDNPDTFAEDV